MKLRHPWLIRLVALLASAVLRVWVRTLRYRVLCQDGRQHPADPAAEPYVYALWHESVLAATAFKTRIRALISQHADGELIAQICQYLGFGVVRGSTSRGGGKALLELVRSGDAAHVLITPDGPRGPRRQVQLGAVFLASYTGLPIVPIGAAYSRVWRAGSWDHMALPWPFSTVIGFVGAPLSVPPDLSRDDLQGYGKQLEQELARATELAEQWWASGLRPDFLLAVADAPAAPCE